MIHISDYFRTLHEALNTVSVSQFEMATRMLAEAYDEDRTIFAIGNGHSAMTASAFALDLAKQTAPPEPRRRFRAISLADNMAAITAWANDASYEVVFTEQIKSLFRPHDVLLAISASGNSPNVVHTAEWARQNNGRLIALVGFDGGRLHRMADASLLVNVADYGHVETAHLAILHYWVDLFRERLAS